MGYRYNSMAANLRKQESNTIGVLVSWIGQPCQSRLIGGVEEVARQAGHHEIISQSHAKYQNEKETLMGFYDSRICGLITSLAMESVAYDHFDLLTENGVLSFLWTEPQTK